MLNLGLIWDGLPCVELVKPTRACGRTRSGRAHRPSRVQRMRAGGSMRSRLLSLMRVLVAARPAAAVVVILGGLLAACFAGRKSRASERERMSERRARNEMERSQRGVTSTVHLTHKARARDQSARASVYL